MKASITSFWTAVRAHAFLNYRKKRKDYLWGTLTLVCIIVAIRIFVPPPDRVDSSLRLVLLLVPLAFVFAWALQGSQTNAFVPFPFPPQQSSAVFDSPYPRNYKCLPATNLTLVIAPMLLGPTVSLLTWILFCAVDVAPLRLPVPYLLPPVLLMTSNLSTHAWRWLMLWKPAKGGCLTLLSMLVVPLTIFAWFEHVPETVLNLLLLPLLILSVRTSLVSASNARASAIEMRTPGPEKQRNLLSRILVPRPDGQNIATPIQAQTWFMERGGGGAGCAIVIGFLALICFARLFFVYNPIGIPIGIGDIEVGEITLQTLLIFPGILLLCTLSSQILTANLMVPGTTVKTGDKFPILQQMHSIRPMSTSEFVRAINVLTARVALRLSVVAFLVLGVWLCLPAREAGNLAPVGILLLRHATPSGVLLTVLGCALYPAIAWSMMLGTPLSYSWKEAKFMRKFSGIGFPVIFGVTISQIGTHLFFGRNVELPNPVDLMLTLVPLALACLVIKVLFLYTGIRKAQIRELLSKRTLIQVAAGWTALLLCLGLTFVLLAPSVGLPASTIFLYTALVLPANRLIWPMLTIDAARHL